jgi:hypothetical protein
MLLKNRQMMLFSASDAVSEPVAPRRARGRPTAIYLAPTKVCITYVCKRIAPEHLPPESCVGDATLPSTIKQV